MTQRSDQIRIELSWFARTSVAGVIAAVVGAVATLLIVRHWANLVGTILVTALVVVIAITLLAHPEALVVSRTEIRDESGWRRRGWRIPRGDVVLIHWDDNPDLFEPPRLTFVGPGNAVLRTITLEFDPPTVLNALRRFDWPLQT